jgi:uncharacterized protein GlcG (DUF336 family)
MAWCKMQVSVSRLALALAALALAAGSFLAAGKGSEASTVKLTDLDVAAIVEAAAAQADQEASLLRVDQAGNHLKTKMHIVVEDRDGKILVLHSMPDAWVGSIDIAKAKAYTAAAFSSDENALTTRSIGLLSQPGGPLWQIGNSNRPGTDGNRVRERGIIEFPGGLPLYKNGKLVGGIGVSGDGVDQDEAVAKAGAAAFQPAPAIRIDTVLSLPGSYTK